MLGEKLAIGAGFGFILGFIAMIGSLHDGKAWGESLGMIPSGVILGIIVAFWFYMKSDDKDEEGNVVPPSRDQQVTKLQNELQSAYRLAMNYEAKGEIGSASLWRSEIAVIESKLRALGA